MTNATSGLAAGRPEGRRCEASPQPDDSLDYEVRVWPATWKLTVPCAGGMRPARRCIDLKYADFREPACTTSHFHRIREAGARCSHISFVIS